MEVTSYLTDERTLTLFQQIARTIYVNLSCPQGGLSELPLASGTEGRDFGRQNLDFATR